MKGILLISYDYHRPNEAKTSFAITNLISFIKSNINEKNFLVDSFSFNMNEGQDINNQYYIMLDLYNIRNYDIIAISLYCWNKLYVNNLIDKIKLINNKALIVLGGYEVSNIKESLLTNQYPLADYFIAGYAEESLLSLIKGQKQKNKIIYKHIDITQVPAIYSTGFNEIEKALKVRIESKRGCPFRCSFCAHRDTINNQVLYHNVDKVIKELKYLNTKDIKKVNFVDPIFNVGETYLDILEAMVQMKFKHLVSFQVRFELIRGEAGEKFINLVSQLNCILEFGLQTIDPEESYIVNRQNNKKKIEKVINQLNKNKIKYLVSLIYGLPKQTINSFKESINFLIQRGCKRIECYPLMLLSGTELYYQREKYHLKETNINGLTYVTCSDSFNNEDYNEMKMIAEKISNMNRKDTKGEKICEL